MLLICVGVFAGVCFVNKKETQVTNDFNAQIEKLKASKDSIIKSNLQQIYHLRNRLERIDYVIEEYEAQLDSLAIKKNKIEYVYEIKYEKIKTLSDTAVEKYWKKEFNND